jgi:hypothetical protein
MAIATARSTVLGLTRTPKHVYSWSDGVTDSGPLPSVTTVLNIVDKSGALVGWAKRETAACAVRNLDMLATMRSTGGDAAAVNWLKAIPDYQRDTAADIGTRVHALAESMARGEAIQPTDEERPFVVAYRRFMEEWQPRYLAIEDMVASLEYRYAGTLDAIVEMAGGTWMLDVKTGAGVYPETSLQLAAYSFADFIGRPADPKRYVIPPITAYAVLHLRPEGYEVVPYDVTPRTFEAFLHARSLFEWRETQAPRVMGQPLGRAIK